MVAPSLHVGWERRPGPGEDSERRQARPSSTLVWRAVAPCQYVRIEPWMERALLEKMEQDVGDVFAIMLDCGMRPEEVMRSRWEDRRTCTGIARKSSSRTGRLPSPGGSFP